MNESGKVETFDDRFEECLHQALEDRRPDRDPAIRMRLDRARRLALAEPPARSSAWWLGGPMVAAACLLVVTIVVPIVVTIVAQLPRETVGPVESLPMTADLDIITDPRFELLLEDPEFVAWLASDGATGIEQEHSG